ncbi:MAG TPA: hypothetical protein VK669_06770 [Candidatus Limnocylindrales bacterium]|nr:hypothetical protein [Candidatus Limnocylindrales bacterium]
MAAFRTVPAFAALALACAAPALGQPASPAPSPVPTGNAAGAELTARVDAAIANATSYRVTVNGPNGLTVDIREWGPDRVKITRAIGAATGSATAESIVIGTAMYYREPGTEWKAAPVPAISRVRRNRLYMGAPDTLLQPLPDRSEGGATVGAFRSDAAGNGQRPGSMDCTYDKATFRPRACTVVLQGSPAQIHVAYGGWDDPANVVEPPPGVAPPPPPTPPPSPSPSASPRGSH